MAGIILDAQLHAISKYLVKLENFVQEQYQGTVNIQAEITQLNADYGFVIPANFEAFLEDVLGVYHFERNRSLSSISAVAFTKFKLDNLTGNNRIQQLKNELSAELAAIR